MQSKRTSMIEALANTAVGFVITYLTSPFIYWLCGVQMKPGQMGLVTLCFTILSIIRGYVIRRYFNGKIVRFNSSK